MATINDVARESGVSYSTVTRVLKGSTKVDDKTAKKVIEAMRKLNYRSDIYGAGAVKESTNSIGIVASTSVANWFYLPVFETIFNTADQMGYGITMCQTSYIYGIKRNVDVVKLMKGKVDGIIFIGEAAINDEDIKVFRENGYPMITLFSSVDIPGIIKIEANNYKAAYEAAEYLIKLGHTKIAHIMGHKFNSHSKDRLNGYIKALEDNNLEVQNGLIKVGNFSSEETYQCSLDLIDNYEFSAVFCGNDEMAAAFMRAARDRNLKIPEDISVIGFDDITFENTIARDLPLITTFRQLRNDMAFTAVKVLIDSINGKEVEGEYIFTPQLIERNSTGSPPTP